MISFIGIILRNYIFCFLGACVRYLLDLIKSIVKKENKVTDFKKYRDYDKQQDLKMLDAIIGFFVFTILVTIIVRVIKVNQW